MKEGKQQQKFQIKVKLLQGEDKLFTTTNIMNANGTFMHSELSDILLEVADFVKQLNGNDSVVKIDQTVSQITQTDLIKVPTSLLTGLALDYALADVLNWVEPFYDTGKIRLNDDHYLTYDEPDPDGELKDTPTPESMNHYCQWAPSRMMTIASRLMKKYKISVTPTTMEIQNPSVEAVLKLTDFDNNPARIVAPSYESAICLVIVLKANGELTSIPADFEQYLIKPAV